MTKALIIGGGVAGPVLAMALSRVGVHAEVFERDGPDSLQRGSWLNFQANGMDALHAIDAAGPVEAIGFEVESMSFINGKGRFLGRMPMAARRPDGMTAQMMPRAALIDALSREARARGVPMHYGKRFITASADRTGVVAEFADGSTSRGDILIGADGMHSIVRTLIDPNATPPRYVPVLNVGGYVPDVTVDVPPREFQMQFGSRSFFAWMPAPAGGTVWFANPPMKAEPERGMLSGMSDSEWRRWLHELMRGDVGPSSEIIDAARGPITGWATYDLPVVANWHDGQGRMVIIGDAAHATSPAAGQGASMALEDAVILAQCLRDSPDTASAFATFESIRRGRTERIVRAGHRSSVSKAAGPVGRVFRDLVLPIVFRKAARDDGDSMMWLQGHHIDFDQRIRQGSGAGGDVR